MSDEKLIKKLVDYWGGIKGENTCPDFYDFDSGELGMDWENCFLAEARNNKFYYVEFGEKLVEAYAKDLASEEVKEDDLYPETPSIVYKFLETINAQEPLIFDGAFINYENEDVRFRKVLLPLGADGVITHIIGGMIWERF